MNRSTIFSDDRLYRYTLWREWDESLPYLMVIGLNPSVADETLDDPTIRKCRGFAKQWGFGSLCMTNLFAWRDTDPSKMKKVAFPIGESNQHHLLRCASGAGMVLAAWGAQGSHLGQDAVVKCFMRQINITLHCLRPTKDGHPGHPLYIPYSEQPQILK